MKRPGVFRETIQDKKYMTDKAKKVVDSANALSDAVKEAGGCLMVIAQVPAKDGEKVADEILATLPKPQRVCWCRKAQHLSE